MKHIPDKRYTFRIYEELSNYDTKKIVHLEMWIELL